MIRLLLGAATFLFVLSLPFGGARFARRMRSCATFCFLLALLPSVACTLLASH